MNQPNFNTVKGKLYVFLSNMVGEVVNGKTIEEIDPSHKLSGLQRLRELRKEGLIDYECINPQKSQYLIKKVV